MNKPPTELTRSALTRAELIQIMVGLGLAMLLSALDQSIVATAMPTIAADLGDFAHLPWIVTAYLVASTAVTPLYGKLADIHGARAMLLIGVATFVAGSIFCALAPSMSLLALARGVQGLGGGGLIALAQTVIADLVAPRERGRVMTYFSVVFIAASVGGPALGGVFSEHLHWSLIFWINVPLGVLAFCMSWFHLGRVRQRRHPHRLDIAGALLLVIGSSATQLALSWGGERYAWSSAPILSLLAAAGAAWALFAWRTRAAEEPLIPLAVLGDAVVRDATLSGAFGLGTFVALSMFLPIYFEGALGLTADRSGLALIPLTVATVAGATIAGRLMSRTRHYKAAPLVGLAAATVAMAALWLWLDSLSLVALDALLAVAGLGVGAMLPVTTVSVQNAVPAHNIGTATAVTQFSRQLGGVFIVAIFGAIVIGGGPSAAPAEPDTLRAAFRAALGIGALFLLASCLFLARMEERPLHGGE